MLLLAKVYGMLLPAHLKTFEQKIISFSIQGLRDAIAIAIAIGSKSKNFRANYFQVPACNALPSHFNSADRVYFFIIPLFSCHSLLNIFFLTSFKQQSKQFDPNYIFSAL